MTPRESLLFQSCVATVANTFCVTVHVHTGRVGWACVHAAIAGVAALMFAITLFDRGRR